MKNRKTIALALLAVLLAVPAHALDARTARQLQALAPGERREQRCDIEAMNRIARQGEGFRPDKVIAYTFADPVEEGDLVRAPGAVFRSRGDWYHLKYRCETADHGLAVQSFRFRIGAKVPRADWPKYYLYD